MKIYVIRHGLTAGNKSKIINGRKLNEPILEEGIPDIEKAAKMIPKGLSKMYVSSMLRARQTAEILNKELGLQMSFHPEIEEIDFGDLSGKSWNQIKEEFGENIWELYKKQEQDFTPYHGESFEDVKKRVISFLEWVKTQHAPDEQVLLVAHGGILRFLHHTYTNEHYEGAENASLHEFEI